MFKRGYILSRFITLTFTYCVSLPGSGQLYANPVYPDERSLRDGGQIYALYCSECHGGVRDRSVRLSDDRGTVAPAASIDLPDTAPVDELPQVPEAKDKTAWPDWARRPDPRPKSKPSATAEALNEAAMIRETPATLPQPSEPGHAGSYNRQPGATDLSDPQTFFYGTSEEEMFNSIARGTGAAMPGWRTDMGSEEDIWDVVNYIRSFWDEAWLY